jgi:hypothetical protein
VELPRAVRTGRQEEMSNSAAVYSKIRSPAKPQRKCRAVFGYDPAMLTT